MTMWIPKIVELYGKGGELQQKTIQRTEDGPIEILYPIPQTQGEEHMKKEIKHQICGDGFIQYHPVKTPAQPDMWESILGAVARGWCYEENANKTMDSELAVAIAKEVQALFVAPQRTAAVGEDTRRAWVGLTDDDCFEALKAIDSEAKRLPLGFSMFAANIQAKLKEKNT